MENYKPLKNVTNQERIKFQVKIKAYFRNDDNGVGLNINIAMKQF